jgi:DNA-binding HxlR family transcriptional regulator
MTKVKPGADYTNVMDLQDVSSVIRFLNDAGKANAFDLRAVIPTYDRMKRTLEAMKDAGLVNIEYITSPRIVYTYSLTEKGKKVGKKLQEIDDIIRT